VTAPNARSVAAQIGTPKPSSPEWYGVFCGLALCGHSCPCYGRNPSHRRQS